LKGFAERFVLSGVQLRTLWRCRNHGGIDLGCSPVAVNANKEEILVGITKGQGVLQIQDENKDLVERSEALLTRVGQSDCVNCKGIVTCQ
jgi:hypothetical protein